MTNKRLAVFFIAEYLGCYTDGSNRNLPISKGQNILTLTPDWCIVLCSQDGFDYAGVNNGKKKSNKLLANKTMKQEFAFFQVNSAGAGMRGPWM